MLKKALLINNSHVECLCDYARLLKLRGRNLESENHFLRALQVNLPITNYTFSEPFRRISQMPAPIHSFRAN